ncbi:MAG: DNA cytosine methyltransferase [Acutalibacteraceae bacterium]
MKVLIACEESQAVCKAFRDKGHEAYSCDIIECSGGHPEWHIKQDVLPLLNGNCKFATMDGTGHQINSKWDLIIAHPPCIYLTNCATRHFSLRVTPAEKVVKRWENRAKAAVFFMHFVLADCEKIAVENPVGFMNAAYKKPTQIIHPYMFADSIYDREQYVTKATCLWLKGLPPLKTNGLPKPNNAEIYGRMPSGKARTWEDTYSRKSEIRSKTFPGIAKAMAEQWGGVADENK